MNNPTPLTLSTMTLSTIFTTGLAALIVLLTGCAGTLETGGVFRAEPVDHIEKVEQDVRRKGGHVVWVNPPLNSRRDSETGESDNGPHLLLEPEEIP